MNSKLPVWDLSRFYASSSDPKLAADMLAISKKYKVFNKKYKGKISALNASQMESLISEIELLEDRVSRVSSYASLLATTDTINPVYGALLQKVMEWGTELSKLFLFFGLEWKKIPQEQAAKIMNGFKNKTFAHYLMHIREFAPYILEEKIEEVILEKDLTGSTSFNRLFSQLTSTLVYKYDKKSLTQSGVMKLLSSKKRTSRMKASEAITKTLLSRKMELTHIYNTLIADKMIEERRRGYKTWLTGRNISNKVSDKIVESLVEAVTGRYSIVSKHYLFKKSLLKIPKLYDYDRYAPISFLKNETKISFGEAQKKVLKAYNSFSPEVGKIIEGFFENNYIHAELLLHKRGGAFCASTAASVHPYILVNYTERREDIMTLAHELGHGLHQYLAGKNQGNLGQSMPLTTQELASTFGEMVVFNYLKNEETSNTQKLAMLVHKIDGMIATVFRQIAMHTFEDQVHSRRRKEGELSFEQISGIWIASQRLMFGKSVVLRDEYSSWWSYISHFIHSPGYVYSYAFGELLALSLYKLYQNNPTDFTPKYISLLKSGDSDYPLNLLKKIGVDMSKPSIWREGLNIIDSLVDEEIALAREL